jgi:DNA primase
VRGVDLLGIIGQDVPLKRVASTNGGEWAGACPFCGGRDRFRVWPDPPDGRPRYWCRQCGRKGDAIQYLRDKHGLSYAEAKERLGLPGNDTGPITQPGPSRPPEPLPDPPPPAWQDVAREVVVRCVAALWSGQHDEVLDYLHRRGLTDRTIWRARLGYNARRCQVAGNWLEAGIVIPWYMDSDLWCLNVRRFGAGPKYKALGGSIKALYGTASLAGQSVAVLVEGEFDALLLQQEAGDLVGAVATGGAQGIPQAGLEYLLPCRRLFVCGDNDAAGAGMVARWKALSARVRPVKVPQGKDVTELWQQGGRVRDMVVYWLAREELRHP